MLKTGIIGCGKVAHLHAKALKSLKDSDFTSVFSRTIGKARDFGNQYQVRAYDHISKMILNEKLDLVIICTPHPNHLKPTVEALNAGAHVLIEKPMAASLADCDAMIHVAKENKKKLGVVSQRRWYTPVQRVKKAIEEGKIGQPVLGTVNMLGWRDENYYKSDPWRGSWMHEGGGVLVNQAPHQFDVLLWFMGAVHEVYGAWANLNHPYIEVEDTALAIIKFKNGALGNIIVSNSQKPGIFGKIQIHGSNGASVGVQPEGGAMFIAGMSTVEEPPIIDLWTIPGEESLLNQWNIDDSKFFNTIDPTVYYIERQIEDFINSIKSDKEPAVTAVDGRKTVELFTAIYRSQRDQKPIKFPLTPENDLDDFDGRIKP